MKKKLQVFISSTYEDLKEERQAAVQAIVNTGHIPVSMELFEASKLQMQTIQKWIDESDIYMLILGGRYGLLDPVSGKSYTHLTYEYALSKNMPMIVVVLDDSFLYIKANYMKQNKIFENKNIEKYNSFKSEIRSKTVNFVENINQITTSIQSRLIEIYNDPNYNLTGWSKNMPISKIDNFSQISTSENIDNKPLHASTTTTNKISVFVVMPFSETWSDETYDIVREVCNNLDISLKRADEILGSQSIYNDIITNIIESDIIIADITVKNANVFYELGYAHALKKNVILIRQPNDNVPFDIAQFRYIEYELSFKKAKEFQKRLTDTITMYKKKL